MKFLVLWSVALEKVGPEVYNALLKMPDYAQKLEEQKKIEKRYHIVGRHGGAWIYDVSSNEELDRLLAMAPIFNYARYEVLPLAEMQSPETVIRPSSR